MSKVQGTCAVPMRGGCSDIPDREVGWLLHGYGPAESPLHDHVEDAPN